MERRDLEGRDLEAQKIRAANRTSDPEVYAIITAKRVKYCSSDNKKA